MKLLLTGATGYLGQFIGARALAEGATLTALGRSRPHSGAWLPFDLNSPVPPLPPADALIHAAFDHLPGRYRGGEGDDPAGFLQRNRDGSRRLFDAAQTAGIPRVIFLSTRAVYGRQPPGTPLHEALPLAPDTLYGSMKADLESDLHARASADFTPASLRITGVYGQPAPGAWHKWADLLDDFLARRPIAPRVATEVHGADMADAVWRVIKAAPAAIAAKAFNVSDLMLDRRALLTAYAEIHDLQRPLPDQASGPAPNAMDCARLAGLGWKPGGWPRLRATLRGLPPS